MMMMIKNILATIDQATLVEDYDGVKMLGW